MPQDRKKAREQRIFLSAQRIRPDLWPKGQTDFECERPDVVVVSAADSKRYGIELTEVMLQTATQSDAAEAKICALAKQSAERRHGRELKLRVTAAFAGSRGGPIEKQRWPAVAEELVDIVSALDCGVRGQQAWSREVSVSGGLESHNFEAVWAHHLPDGIDDIWQPSRAGSVRPLYAQDLQEVIDRKNGRVRAYRTRCDHVDLLIAVNGAAVASAACLTDSAIEATYTTEFDRVFVLDMLMRRVHALRRHIDPSE